MEEGGGNTYVQNSSEMNPSMKSDQRLKDSFSEAAFGNCADSVWLMKEKAELGKQIYFSTLNALNGKWIPADK